jgi:hypothetical protein
MYNWYVFQTKYGDVYFSTKSINVYWIDCSTCMMLYLQHLNVLSSQL